MINSQTKIEDSLQKCCEYITHAVDFVYNYAKKYEDLLPFHFDFVQTFPNVLMVSQAIKKYQPQERDTDSDTDDSDSDSDYRRDEYDFVDCVGDLYSKLKANNCIYAGSVIQSAPYQIDNFKITSNVQLNKRFEIWKQTKLSKKYKGDEFNDYPRRKRFICMIDRRNRDKSGNDKCVFWETCNDSNSFPIHPDFPVNQSQVQAIAESD